MNDIFNHIVGADKLTSIFGYWPSFHDAEVTEIILQRNGKGDGYPRLTATIHVFEMTREISVTGNYVCRHHSLVDIRFYDIFELQLEHFNHQNALSGITIEHKERPGKSSSTFRVGLHSAYGLDSGFACRSIELLSVAAGIPLGSVYASHAVGA